MIPQDLEAELRKQFGLSLFGAQPVGGGCIHQAFRLETSEGPRFFKFNRLVELPNLNSELLGLTSLSQTQTLRTPRPFGIIQTGQHVGLLMEFLEASSPQGPYWESFGHQLAQFHSIPQTLFGWESDNFIGRLPQHNPQMSSWIDFFVQARISPLLKDAVRHSQLNSKDWDQWEKLMPSLPDIFPDEPPAMIHGDLWGGNILAVDGGNSPAWIDPSVHCSHREMELAFMTLFDRIPDSFYRAYEEVYPLSPNWLERWDLYNLYPLLVHVRLFGGNYASSFRQHLRRYL
ncbi:fructosamine kinase family protein [Pontibacter sp. G13]|uniref:fructosamine kinase family protein n=1 Tax=Pontibacter sp. G13 TaxID=3074898 RepID=UPI00288B0407|nr:fructosamine kinase family protein [Pontibacter sp. G13]WNJ21419.1 fructosamine kinase family protein [Pontibacter sp. G13]